MTDEELNNTELFLFTENLVFESMFYKGTSKSPLLLYIFLRLHQVQMREYLILQIIHTEVTQMIEAGTNGLP